MLDKLNEIQATALSALKEVQDKAALQAWKQEYTGGNSELTGVFKGIGKVAKEERGKVGKRANEVKVALMAALDEHSEAIKTAELARSLEEDHLDVTLPGRPFRHGGIHPATQTLRRILTILGDMGFQVYTSREVESDAYNFEHLNFPPGHPAREMQDSFYIEGTDTAQLMRTHTSPGQIRAMREYAASNPENPPPIRISLPGMCYRSEQITARSEIQFNQVEGLAVGENITFSDLKGTLNDFARRMFGQDARTRFRAQHFPFTEPSAEMDVECFLCGGEGCNVCKKSGWLEILGCGMVHPNVLTAGGYDPSRYTGFAFGMGPERQAMLRHNIKDIRYFWGNDSRFLEQF
ncbi:MAG: phenylalanine--tRNA ligase subunit alpha [Anaerolineae bacterium]|jgi:phenylalanyl-tRNA synthetase alpha chain|nr:phenylalanine--tRNA ligase subunit alpha [Anaerolineae bacterium]MBT7074181.1 phenylalanine--tRNA ligase subunit alpha [Anaerolineae bacterium]MBT7782359.1 phenylalanine--tRNA ligase subunit alpha [Anaerolineae bacterium]